MQVVLIILSVGLLGLIVYFAVSPKSSRLLKLTAFIALGLIGLSIGVAGFFLIMGPGESEELIPLPVFHDAQPQAASNSNLGPVIGFLVVFAIIMGLIVYLALREQRRKEKAPKSASKAPVFPVEEELNIDGPDMELGMEDGFEIEKE